MNTKGVISAYSDTIFRESTIGVNRYSRYGNISLISGKEVSNVSVWSFSNLLKSSIYSSRYRFIGSISLIGGANVK